MAGLVQFRDDIYQRDGFGTAVASVMTPPSDDDTNTSLAQEQ